MSVHFRTKPLNANTERTDSNKVYAKSTEHLPVEIDCQKRYSVLHTQSEQFLDRIHNFEVRKDDVWVITMPKCGTTWMLELVWLLLNDLDFETALKVEQEKRSPFFEYCAIYPFVQPQSLDVVENLKSPRLIKSHLPMHLLPKQLWTVKPKIIYVAREAKDAALSYRHFLVGLGNNKASSDEFLNTFLSNGTSFGPFWDHIAEFWKIRNESFIYFTSFEKMKKDLRQIVMDVCNFLQKSYSDEEVEKLLDHLSFEKMKNNPVCNHLAEIKVARDFYAVEGDNSSFNFFRKGKVGSHKEELSQEMIQKFDEWTKDCLKPYGVSSDEILFK